METLPVTSRGVTAGTTPVTTRVGAASLERDVTAELQIVTKEGDTVTLDASYDLNVTYAAASGRAGRWRFGAFAARAQVSTSVSLQVKGSLSPQESADIAAVVRRFLHDLRALERGRDVSIANVAAGDPRTLQSVSATAESQTTLTVIAGTALGQGALPVAAPTAPNSAAPAVA